MGGRSDVKTGFKAACRRAEIEGLRFHDLRHTFAIRLVEKGVDIETVRDLLGHSSIIVTQRYTHSNDERKRAAVELLSCDVCVTHGRINQACARSSADRAVDFESEGRGFESLRACQL
jgi:Phage integrase family